MSDAKAAATPRTASGARALSNRLLPPTVGLCIFAAAMLAAEFAHRLVASELAARERADTLGFAGAVRAGIDRELNSVLFMTSGLGAYLAVRRDSLDDREISAILKQLHADNRHIRSFGIAVGHRIRYVYPVVGNEKAIGLYYPDNPSQWPAVRRAIDSNRGTLAGPLPLVQGGEGLVFRSPVRIDGQYWGLLSTVVDTQSLFRAAFGELRHTSYDFAIRGRDGLGWQGETFLGDASLFDDPRTVSVTMEVPNGQWIIAARARGEQAIGHIGLLLRAMGMLTALLLSLGAIILLRHRAELARQALFDPLTALPNRRYLEDNCDETQEETLRESNNGLLFIDLDGFKQINDRCGHKAGDVVLKIVGERLCGQVRAGDTVARWGGDELVVVVADTDVGELERLSRRLRQAIEQPIEADGRVLEISASIGWALPPADGHSLRDLLKVADQRMYDEKKRRQGAT
jgi:diguanylate cyclase (GGDEF)-like protein